MINKPRKLEVMIDVRQLAELLNIMGEKVVLQLKVATFAAPAIPNEEDITEFATSDPNSELPKPRSVKAIWDPIQELINQRPLATAVINEVEPSTTETEEDEASTSRRGPYKRRKPRSSTKKNQKALRQRLNIAKPSGKLDVNKAKSVKLEDCGLLDSDIVEDLAALGITSLGQLIKSTAEEIAEKSARKSKDGKPIPADPMYMSVLINTIRQRLKPIGVQFRKRDYVYNS